ncbi:MAG: hypothetical protein GY730_11265 [bacterium]|nr:hypothetical protein [bacterium]
MDNMINEKEEITCGNSTEIYTRVVGFYRPVDQWNDGKKEEFIDRAEYELNNNNNR